MSYELTLLPCPAGLAGCDAADWFGSYDEPDDADDLALGDADRAAWARIVAEARGLLPDAEEQSSDEHAELTWPDAGVQLEFWPGDATVTVAYWHEGPAAAAIVRAARDVASIVAAATGWRAFDPQLGALLDECDADSAAAEYLRRVAVARRSAGRP